MAYQYFLMSTVQGVRKMESFCKILWLPYKKTNMTRESTLSYNLKT